MGYSFLLALSGGLDFPRPPEAGTFRLAMVWAGSVFAFRLIHFVFVLLQDLQRSLAIGNSPTGFAVPLNILTAR